MKGMALPLAFVTVAACGDAMLPSDYTGPPAGTVTGNVVVPTNVPAATADAAHPRLSLEWLVDRNVTTPLVTQPVSFQRSVLLQHDWDIGLSLPTDGAKFEVDIARATSKALIGVAKMVYFDDRDGSGRIDWACASDACNHVLAISTQYVVFVDQPPTCGSRPGQLLSKNLRTGYHYYTLDGTYPREMAPTDSMSFVVVQGNQTISAPPTTDLRNFADSLIRSWNLVVLTGC
jgi:hypothetical protein